MILTQEQIKIIKAPEKKIVVLASAGTSKTLCLTERIRHLLRSGYNPNEMVAITFTNNSAQEMRERLGDDYKEGMFVGTVHSYANQLLLTNGINTSHLLNKEKFDELFELIIKHPEVIKPIHWLGLDEAQDSSYDQFKFIFDMLLPKEFFIAGDEKQMIYGFAGASSKHMLSLITKEETTVLKLTENWRSGAAIINYTQKIAKLLTGRNDKVVCKRDNPGKVFKIKTNSIVGLIQRDGNYGDWAILCRENSTKDYWIKVLKSKGIPCLTFRQAQGSNDELKQKMKENSVKVLTMHSSKGLQWKKVIMIPSDYWAYSDDRMKMDDLNLKYVATSRAEDELYVVEK